MAINWTAEGNIHRAELGSTALLLVVWLDGLMAKGFAGPRYCAKVFGRRLRGRFEDADQAKIAAEDYARELLARAVVALEQT